MASHGDAKVHILCRLSDVPNNAHTLGISPGHGRGCVQTHDKAGSAGRAHSRANSREKAQMLQNVRFRHARGPSRARNSRFPLGGALGALAPVPCARVPTRRRERRHRQSPAARGRRDPATWKALYPPPGGVRMAAGCRPWLQGIARRESQVAHRATRSAAGPIALTT
jgi:hypothetical protein